MSLHLKCSHLMIKTASAVVLKLTGKEAIMPQQTFKMAKIQMTAIRCRSNSLLAQIIFGKLMQRKLHFVDDMFYDRKAEQLRSPSASKRSERRRTGEQKLSHLRRVPEWNFCQKIRRNTCCAKVRSPLSEILRKAKKKPSICQ